MIVCSSTILNTPKGLCLAATDVQRRIKLVDRFGSPIIATLTPVGQRACITLETQRGYRLTVANESTLFAVRQGQSFYIPVSELDNDCFLGLPRSLSFTPDYDQQEFDEGWVIGAIVGDGGHNPNNAGGTYLRFWGEDDGPNVMRAANVLRSFGVSRTFNAESFYEATGPYTLKTAKLEAFVDQYIKPRSKVSRDALINAQLSFLSGYLQGFFDTDGSAQGSTQKGRSVRLSQSDQKKLIEAQVMLMRFGIASNLYFRRAAGTKQMPDGKGGLRPYDHKSQWELVIAKDNIEHFETRIGFSKPTKNNRLSELTGSLSRKPYADKMMSKFQSVTPVHVEDAVRLTVPQGVCVIANGLII